MIGQGTVELTDDGLNNSSYSENVINPMIISNEAKSYVDNVAHISDEELHPELYMDQEY